MLRVALAGNKSSLYAEEEMYCSTYLSCKYNAEGQILFFSRLQSTLSACLIILKCCCSKNYEGDHEDNFPASHIALFKIKHIFHIDFPRPILVFVFLEYQNFFWLRGASGGHLIQQPAQSRASVYQLSQVLNFSKNGDSIAHLGLADLLLKSFFINNRNFCCYSLCALSHVLSQHIFERSPCLSSLYRPIRWLKAASDTRWLSTHGQGSALLRDFLKFPGS